MPTKEKNEVRMVGVLPSQGADPIPVRLVTDAPGAGMIEKNEVRMVGVLPSQGADPIPVSIDFPANMCRIKTGQYTGDGTLSQAVTGVGFQPKTLKIDLHFDVEQGAAQYYGYFTSDQITPLTWYLNTDGSPYLQGHRIISLDADGFTVDDDGGNVDPNKLDQVYDYVALG